MFRIVETVPHSAHKSIILNRITLAHDDGVSALKDAGGNAVLNNDSGIESCHQIVGSPPNIVSQLILGYLDNFIFNGDLLVHTKGR